MTKNNEKILYHIRFGKIIFRKIHNSLRIKILIQPEKNILVTLPENEQFSTAKKFFLEKLDWVEKNLKQMQKKIKQHKTLFTPDTEFGTYSRKIQLLPDNRTNVRVQITPDTVFIYYPESRSVDDAILQSVIRKAVEYAWKVEAHEVLPKRIEQLSQQHSLPYKKLLIKKTVSYWGLCASDNTITLNIHIMHLPLYLIDFIILHELCHTIHKNHGGNFHELLNYITGGKERQYSKEMKQYSTRLY